MDSPTAAVQADDELSLPRATVYKIIQEILPPGISCPKETRDLLIDCCTEFVHLISSEANEVCERAGRKTISPEHVVDALRALGFGDYVEEVMASYEEFQEQVREKDRTRASHKLDSTGMTEEELQRQQEELFAKARLKYQQSQLSANTAETEVIDVDNTNNKEC